MATEFFFKKDIYFVNMFKLRIEKLDNYKLHKTHTGQGMYSAEEIESKAPEDA